MSSTFFSSRSAQQQPAWHIICDFDGTLTPFDVTDAVLERFAAPLWMDIETSWLQGHISAKQCMEQQVALITAPKDKLHSFLLTVPVDPDFQKFYAFCQHHGYALTIVSDGIDYCIHTILANHNLQHLDVIANQLIFLSHDTYQLAFPYHDVSCPSGVCKCAIAKKKNARIVLIGDGLSDCCVASTADLIFAKKEKTLHQHCRSNGYTHASYTSFADIQKLFINHVLQA